MRHVFALLVHWAPRVLAFTHMLFLGVFALDVFDSALGSWQTLLALVIHLLPSLAIVFVLLLAWRHSLAGFVGFALLSVIFALWILEPSDGTGFYILLGPIVLCCLLFLSDWLLEKRNHSSS